jgi:hypothetical protein
MASRGHLNQLAAVVRDDALGTLWTLLPEDDDGREAEALMRAQRDVVARQDPQFQLTALIAALARIVAGQQEEIAQLKRMKANAAALAKK